MDITTGREVTSILSPAYILWVGNLASLLPCFVLLLCCMEITGHLAITFPESLTAMFLAFAKRCICIRSARWKKPMPYCPSSGSSRKWTSLDMRFYSCLWGIFLRIICFLIEVSRAVSAFLAVFLMEFLLTHFNKETAKCHLVDLFLTLTWSNI